MNARYRDKCLSVKERQAAAYITKGHPNDIKPLYVDFKPTIPIDYTSRWRDAYNLSRLIAGRGDEYGKTWIAYRSKPKEDDHD